MNQLSWLPLVLVVAVVPPSNAAPAGGELARDSVLAGLLGEALAARPELAQAQAAADADRARVAQAGALPDPVLSLGVQNDGFDALRIGQMETSWWSVGAAQTFPWHGKRGLRSRVQSLSAQQSDADLARARLSVQAEVEGAYLDLLLVRDRLRVLGTVEVLWTQAEGLSRSRYETGDGAQSDILRAQLERSRLQQERWGLLAEERRSLAVLNRSVGHPLDQPVATALSLADLSDPAAPDSASAISDAEARTPELAKAAYAVDQSRALVALARKERMPDVTLSLGVMPRGALAPMWQAGLSVPLPLWDATRGTPAVDESRLRGQAAEGGAETLRRLVRQRVEERRALLAALRETNHLYRASVLVQSKATVSSTMAQYQVGRVPFASVLEALRGYFADLIGFYESVAATQRIDIAQRALSLDPAAAGRAPAAPAAGSPSTATSRM
jgi:outer membrane protein TolC